MATDPVELAHRWFKALEDRDASTAAELVSEDCRIMNPTGGDDLVGPAGARQLVQMAPPQLKRIIREERAEGNTAVLKGLARLPGVFANYTTWTLQTDGERITSVRFEWRPAN